MDQINQEYLNRIKGRYTEKYTTAMDDWTAIILHEVSEGVAIVSRENKSKLDESIQKIIEASKKIDGQVHQVHFENRKQAFFYGLGKHLMYGLASMICISFCIWIYTTQTDFAVKNELVNKYPSIEKFESIYRSGKTISKNGYEFLVVYPSKGDDVKFAYNYMYDKENNRVLIPIGTK